ncbi:MAG: hypothetical protein AAF696_08275 [Bacteroidota bacterium]
MVHLAAQESIHQLRVVLIERMEEKGKRKIQHFPPISQDLNLISNASFRNDSIILGRIQATFQSFDDSLSIVYHEYTHFLLSKKKRFRVGTNEKGEILQWDTGIIYTYTPYPEQVAAQVEYFREKVLPTYTGYAEMGAEEKERIIADIEKGYAKPDQMRFIYSPSRLAKEEIRAYRQQLKGEKLGLYQLTPSARQNIYLRIKQKKDTYKMNRAYEKKHKLKQSGEKKA